MRAYSIGQAGSSRHITCNRNARINLDIPHAEHGVTCFLGQGWSSPLFPVVENLGPDYIDRHKSLIEAVDAESVARVARRLLDPDRLLIVVAGEPEGLASPD